MDAAMTFKSAVGNVKRKRAEAMDADSPLPRPRMCVALSPATSEVIPDSATPVMTAAIAAAASLPCDECSVTETDGTFDALREDFLDFGAAFTGPYDNTVQCSLPGLDIAIDWLDLRDWRDWRDWLDWMAEGLPAASDVSSEGAV
jgi:hypothetical protein